MKEHASWALLCGHADLLSLALEKVVQSADMHRLRSDLSLRLAAARALTQHHLLHSGSQGAPAAKRTQRPFQQLTTLKESDRQICHLLSKKPVVIESDALPPSYPSKKIATTCKP